MSNHTIKIWKSGIVNRFDSDDVQSDAAKSSTGWLNVDGKLELTRGKTVLGTAGSGGSVLNLHVGYKVDGTAVLFRHAGSKIQYFNGTTWADSITGIVGQVTFANYSSNAGSFVYITGPSISPYKIVTAQPASFTDMYDSAKNFKGYSIIDKGRMLLWGRTDDKTGLYGSYIDAQDSTVYTTVASESLGTGNGSTTVFSGTLAFKAGNARRTCFGMQITAGAVTGRDDYLGVISGAGVTGTINYTTGAWTLTFTTAPANALAITAKYLHEDSSVKGVLDFTYSATRTKGQGFIMPQDLGGDETLKVIVAQDGSYVSLKRRSAYELVLDATDVALTNNVIRSNIGVPSRGAAVLTDKGLIFINTAQPNRPELTILTRNPVGNQLEPRNIAEHFAWENYEYSNAVMDVFGQFVVLTCKTIGAATNDSTLVINVQKSAGVSVVPFGFLSIIKDGGTLYGGSSITETVYKVFNDFSDDGVVISNSWESKNEGYGASRLKKFMRMRFRGFISVGQYVDIYASYDRAEYVKIGQIAGNAGYVDTTSLISVGTSMVGSIQVGEASASTAGYYEFQLSRINPPKFRTVSLKLVATGIGYASVEEMIHEDIITYEDRIAPRFRNN